MTMTILTGPSHCFGSNLYSHTDASRSNLDIFTTLVSSQHIAGRSQRMLLRLQCSVVVLVGCVSVAHTPRGLTHQAFK